MTGIQDSAHIRPDGTLRRVEIDGVQTRETTNVVTKHAVMTEVIRSDWGVGAFPLQQIIHVDFRPGELSAWHRHRKQTDHIMVVSGTLKVVLYDGRDGSSTSGNVQEYRLSPVRPTLLVIPPDVWHGVHNLEQAGHSAFLNFFDKCYDHDDPDEWRLPQDTDQIPYRF